MSYLWYNAIYQDNNTLVLDVRDPCTYILERARPGVFIIASFSQTIVDPVATIIKMLNDLPDGYDVHKYLYILVNSPAEYRALAQFHGALNIRAWSNACRTKVQSDSVFQDLIIPHIDRKFRGTMCSKNVKFKRHSLTWNIPGINYLISIDKSSCYTHCQCTADTQICSECMWNVIPMNDINQKKHVSSVVKTNLCSSVVYDELHNSRCGIILSPSEGSCYASLEYLLHGLPVISTSSTGGRSNYYDNYNSIICDATKVGVESALVEIQRRWDNGEIDPVKIRAKAILQQNHYQNIYIKVIADIFKCQRIDSDASKYFTDKIKNTKFQPLVHAYNTLNLTIFNKLLDFIDFKTSLLSQKVSYQYPFGEVLHSQTKGTIAWITIAVEWHNDHKKWEHNNSILSDYLAKGGEHKLVSRNISNRLVYFGGQTCLILPGQKPSQSQYLCALYGVAKYDNNGILQLTTTNKEGDQIVLYSVEKP